MRNYRLVVFIQLVLLVVKASAQSIWDCAHLAQVKSCLEQPAYATAYHQLTDEADRLMMVQPVSVMMKAKAPVSGSKHDYMSLSRYYWPDPNEPDGLPYIARDGESNPELENYDRPRLAEMAGRVTTLSLAWYYSNDERYAQKAVEQLRVWFMDKATRMNPNLDYAQIIPGKFDGKGRCYGVIDGYSFVEMLDAVLLLERSKSFTANDSKAMKQWFSQFLNWILTSKQGKEEGLQLNNHSTAHDVQVIAYAKYVGNQKVLREYLGEFFTRRMVPQIEPDGRQPRELRRTLAFGYSQYNLSHIIDVFQIARAASFNMQPEALPLLEKAADFLAKYLGKKVQEWPYQQISEWDNKQNQFAKDLYRLYLLDSKRHDYLRLAQQHIVKRFADRFFLLYYKPNSIDNAFAAADTQLRCLLKNTEKARWDSKDKSRIMPRCVEKDGSLRLVGMRDWCSGFFPGSLWQMYEYSHDAFWRDKAAENTWMIEDVKYHDGTHDLGFMMYNSFGQAYRLTGEQAYRDVVIQSAKTLATRFNEKVGCIRSWSWGTPDRWKFAVIIDNMINLELLFEASRLTNDKRYYDMAVSHANTTLNNHFREDGSSYHVVDYNPEDGKVIKRITHQGLFDESVWSRGQAWGLYGFTMCYRYTHDEAYLRQAQKIARFFFSQQDMPADLIPYWDMRDPAIPNAPRDASAAAVFASGLYELATYSDAEQAKEYRRVADKIISSLVSKYSSEPGTMQGFLLLHSTGNYPAKDEIDVPINYADYYFLEALHRSRSAVAGASVKTLNDGWTFEGTPVNLPHTWNVDAYTVKDYQKGSFTYERQLMWERSTLETWLKIDAAFKHAEVLVNGHPVGQHIGGYTAFAFNLTPYLHDGSNTLQVKVSNQDDAIAPISADFTFMGGIYRDVWLIEKAPKHFEVVDGVNVTADTCNVTVDCRVAEPMDCEVVCVLLDAESHVLSQSRSKADDSTKVILPLPENPQLWSPESPYLYKVVVNLQSKDGRVVYDRQERVVGVRWYAFDAEQGFLLNGNPYKLHGVCIHQDQKPFGIALDDDQHRRDFRLMKEMGVNFVRLAHYPQDDALLEMCDREGMLVWEEIPVVDMVPEGEAFAKNCESQLREMIRQHKHHTSVILWGYMNEILLQTQRRYQGAQLDSAIQRTLQLAGSLEEIVHEEDPTRVSVMAFHGSNDYNKLGLSDVPQVVGWNLYQGWYGSDMTDFERFLERQHRDQPGHPVIVSEYGAGSDLRLHNPKNAVAFDFSMDYQQRYAEHYLPVIEQTPYVCGAAYWNFIDFASANRDESMPRINNKGLVANNRRPKDVYYYYQASWVKKPVVHIAVRDWLERTSLERMMAVKVYSNQSAVELIHNGRSLGIKKVENSMAVFDVDFADGINTLRAIAGGIGDMANVKYAQPLGEIAVNIGSNCHFQSDASGVTWLPDQPYGETGWGFIGGKAIQTQTEIKLTADGPLYQTMREGMEAYRFDVPAGQYELELLWTDTCTPQTESAYLLDRKSEGAASAGAFTVSANGQLMDANLASPQPFTAFRRRYLIDNTDNHMTVSFSPKGCLSAIKIRKL